MQSHDVTAYREAEEIRPSSSTNQWINWVGLCCMLLTFWGTMQVSLGERYVAMLCIVAYAFPIILLEVFVLKTPYRAATRVSREKQSVDFNRVITKLIGLYFTFFVILLLYSLFPEYHKSEYNEFWPFIKNTIVLLVILSVPYFVLMDSRSLTPYDSYWLIGALLCREYKDQPINGQVGNNRYFIKQHILAWIVKAFFLPIMFVTLSGNIVIIQNTDFSNLLSNLEVLFVFSVLIIYSMDVLIATVGYLFTVRLLDSHIRTTEPTSLGWIVCLLCYQPFNYAVSSQYFFNTYEPTEWLVWIKNEYVILAWFCMIFILHIIYALGTLAFGVRFSNLTNRGIITNGVYRFTKHPAYVSKNIFWWLCTVPFAMIFVSPLESIQYCVFLAIVNIVYYIRAKTEEAHLSQDPAYVEYALWMNEHSIFAPLAKRLTFLQYRYKKVIPT